MTLLDKYTPLKRLALGGMGELFLAQEASSAAASSSAAAQSQARYVVIKTLLPALRGKKGHIAAFEDEARILSVLNHPNIVRVQEVIREGDRVFLVLQYIHGLTLEDLQELQASERMTMNTQIVTYILREAAAALEFAHTAVDRVGQPLRLVHRDVSPQNIMVDTTGLVVLVDFGIARADNRRTRTRTGIFKGKLSYVSPEQLTNPREVDGRSDQFALGIVAWELCARRHLFEAQSDTEAVRAVVKGPVPSLRDVRNDVPAELAAVVARMLSRKPKARYPACADVVRALDGQLAKLDGDSARRDLAALVVRHGSAALAERLSAPGTGLVGKLDHLSFYGDPRRTAEALRGPQATSHSKTQEPRANEAKAHRRPRTFRTATALLGLFAAASALVWMRRSTESVSSPPQFTARHEPAVETFVPEVNLNVAPLRQTVVRTPTRETDRVERGRSFGTGFLTLDSAPATTVVLGDVVLGTTPIYRVALPAGVHWLELKNEGLGVRHRQRVKITAGSVAKLKLDLGALVPAAGVAPP